VDALDGNAIAGWLFEHFGSEMTNVTERCTHCGTWSPNRFRADPRAASDPSDRAASGTRLASVPKSRLASAASTRRRGKAASALPISNVQVVLPTPPFGETTAM
jgi:Family of unknown function (DUF6510)